MVKAEQIEALLALLPSREKRQGVGKKSLYLSGVLLISYLAASAVSTVIMSLMLGSSIKQMQAKLGSSSQQNSTSVSLSFGSAPNFRDIKKAIMDRNVFNAEGKFPDEADPSRREGDVAGVFNINAPCNKPTINVELLGTIYLGENSPSMATVRETGYAEADIYKVGDSIIGNEQATIAKVERKKVIINNKGVKECLDLGGDKLPNEQAADGFPTDPSAAAATPPSSQGGSGGATVILDAAFVESELGPGFGKIIQAARLVPNTDPANNQVNGFKIFSIDQASVLGKIGFQNGDVITQVNDISLKLPEQGFALYQAMQENREITIQLLRAGTTPMTINVRVK